MKVYRFFKHLGLCALLASCALPALGSQTEPMVVHTSVTPSAPEVVAPEAVSIKDLQKQIADAFDAAIAKLKIADTSGDVASIKKIQKKIKELDQVLAVLELINMSFADETITEIQNKIHKEPQKLRDFLNELTGKEEIKKALQAIMLQHAQSYRRTTQERYSNLQKAGAGEQLLAIVENELKKTKKRIEELSGIIAEQAEVKPVVHTPLAPSAAGAAAKAQEEAEEPEEENDDDDEGDEAEETDVDEVAVTDQKSQDYLSVQDNIRSQQPIYTKRGALTREGHMQRLEQRQAREAAQRRGQW